MKKLKSNKNSFISQLLPYKLTSKSKGQVLKGLNEYETLLKSCYEATRALLSDNLENFDSLVGENACHIRAIQQGLLEKESATYYWELCIKISLVVKKISMLRHSRELARMTCMKNNLQHIFNTFNLEIEVSKPELALFASFLLTIMKQKRNNSFPPDFILLTDRGDPKKLQLFGEVSTSFAEKVMSKLRRMLATSSVEYVRECAEKSEDMALKMMVSEEFQKNHNTLPCLPMFWTYKAILGEAHRERLPLLVHGKLVDKDAEGFAIVDEECFYYLPAENGTYRLAKKCEIDHTAPVCVVQGIAAPDAEGRRISKENWKKRLQEMNIVDAILAGAADHRQYPDASLDSCIEELKDEEFEHYRMMARKQGFSSCNPTCFFIQHVYAAQGGRLLREVAERTRETAWLEKIDEAIEGRSSKEALLNLVALSQQSLASVINNS